MTALSLARAVDALWCPIPDASARVLFRRECRSRSLQGVAALGVAQVLVLLVTWPTDLLLGGAVALQLAVFRASILGLWGVAWWATRWTAVRERPEIAIGVFAIACPLAAAALGPLTAFDAPWIDICVLVPLFCVLFVQPLGVRVATTGGVSAAFLVIFIALRPEELGNPQLGTFLVSLLVATVGSVSVGHIATFLIWQQFLRSRELQQANASLEATVEERTSELSKLNERLAALHADERARVEQALTGRARRLLDTARAELSSLAAIGDDTASRMQALLHTLELQLAEAIAGDAAIRDLAEAVERMVEAAQPSTTAVLECALESLPHLETEVATSLYRVLQEGLTNALKHAQAEHVWITGRWEAGVLVLVVEDDGVGLREGQRSRHHGVGIGLSSLRERAAALGARLTLEPSSEGGTRVALHLPLQPSSGHAMEDATSE